ncbi:MAG: hypothetical protein ABI193_07150 [Minicystis sp.]
MQVPTSPGAPPTCLDHPTLAVARCASCNRALCDECFRFRLDTRPACARCAYEAATRPQRRLSLAASFLCLAWGGGFWLTRRYDLWNESAFMVVLGALTAPALAIPIALSARSAGTVIVENREPAPDEVIEGAFDGNQSPYRARARRVLLAVSPRVSGRITALVVGASLIGSAALLPSALKLPPWIEAEIVLALWWTIVSATLAVLLHRGFRLRDDYVYFLPWARPSAPGEPGPGKPTKKAKGDGWLDGCGSGCGSVDGCGAADGEGLLAIIAVVVVLGAALGAAWILVELAMPLIFFSTYWLLMRAIGHVARDGHGCQGALGKSIGWGMLWATIYVAPLAGLTWLVHALRR